LSTTSSFKISSSNLALGITILENVFVDYTFRYNVEEKYFLKKNKTRRIGLFKQKSFLGYCRG